MSLAAIRSQLKAGQKKEGKPLVHTRKGSVLFLPPEYRMTDDQWSALIAQYNLGGRIVLVARMFAEYLKDLEPKEDLTQLLSVSEVKLVEGHYVTDLSFNNVKAGLRTMVWYESEKPKLVPVLDESRSTIVKLSLTYLPN